MTDEAEQSIPSRGSHRLRLVAGFAANAVGLLFVIWPVLPREWGVGDFVGWAFGASKDPSMGIQFMFAWLATVPLGGAISAAGTYFANGSRAAASTTAILVMFGGVHFMWWMATGK